MVGVKRGEGEEGVVEGGCGSEEVEEGWVEEGVVLRGVGTKRGLEVKS